MKNIKRIVCAVSLGGLLFGFDTGVISGCEEAVQREFLLAPFWHGLVIAGALIGTVAQPAKGNIFKGPFHIPRMLVRCCT